MRFVLIYFLLFIAHSISCSENFIFDFRGYIQQDIMKLGSVGNLINFKSKGTWVDSQGNYGRGKCQGSVLIENNNQTIDDTIYFCEFEDQDQIKFWTRGNRTGSEKKAGIGSNTYVDAEGKYIKYIGVECIYAISYIKDSFHAKNKCNI